MFLICIMKVMFLFFVFSNWHWPDLTMFTRTIVRNWKHCTINTSRLHWPKQTGLCVWSDWLSLGKIYCVWEFVLIILTLQQQQFKYKDGRASKVASIILFTIVIISNLMWSHFHFLYTNEQNLFKWLWFYFVTATWRVISFNVICCQIKLMHDTYVLVML